MRFLKLRLAYLFRRTDRTPNRVWIEWADLPPHKQWPSQLYLPNVPRNVRGRKIISELLATKSWIWTGRNTIRAWAKLPTVGPKGGSGTAPPKRKLISEGK